MDTPHLFLQQRAEMNVPNSKKKIFHEALRYNLSQEAALEHVQWWESCTPADLWGAGIAQSVKAGQSVDRIPVEARFTPPVQTGLWPNQPPAQ